MDRKLGMTLVLVAGMWTSAASAASTRQSDEQTRANFKVEHPTCSGATLRADSASRAADVECAIRWNVYHIWDLRDHLSQDARGYRNEQTAFDSSIIALGIGSVAAAFYHSSAAALGGVAIVANGVSQYRSYYNPEKTGADHLKAVKSARCVASTAEYFLDANPQRLWKTTAVLRQAIANADARSAELAGAGAGPPGAAKAVAAANAAASESGQDAASKARDAAMSALAALDAEADAYNNAPAVIDQAHDAIKNFVDQAKHRTVSIDFGGVQTALNNGIASAAKSASDTKTARSQLFDAVKAQAKADAQAKQVAPGAGNQSDAPPAPKAGQDQTKAAAQEMPKPDARTAQPPVVQNLQATAQLIAATKDALEQTPNPQFTTISTQITACTASLSS